MLNDTRFGSRRSCRHCCLQANLKATSQARLAQLSPIAGSNTSGPFGIKCIHDLMAELDVKAMGMLPPDEPSVLGCSSERSSCSSSESRTSRAVREQETLATPKTLARANEATFHSSLRWMRANSLRLVQERTGSLLHYEFYSKSDLFFGCIF